jgi:hypothetical protein
MRVMTPWESNTEKLHDMKQRQVAMMMWLRRVPPFSCARGELMRSISGAFQHPTILIPQLCCETPQQ